MSREHMDMLLDEGIQLALHLLEQHGELYPFALALAPDGEVAVVEVDADEDQSDSDATIAQIVEALAEAAQAGLYTATAVVADVLLTDREAGGSQDALQIALEDCASEPVVCYLPYEHVEGRVAPGELISEPGESVIFPEAGEVE